MVRGMQSSKAIAISALVFSLAVGPSARADVADGDVLVPEFSRGTVVNARGGGDLTDVARFARGLDTPMGLCRGPGGDVFVTEHDAGEVTIITRGGDFAGEPAFASGLSGPASLLCTEDQVLVTELNSAQVTDITAGGNFAGAPAFATIDRNPADLLAGSDGRLWVTSFNDGVLDISAGGDFRGVSYDAPNDLAEDSSIAITEMDGMLLVGNEHTDEIVNFTGGGNLSGAPVFARVRGVIGLRAVPATGWLLAASELDDAIYQVAAGGDFTSGAAAFATGLDPFDVAHLLYIDGSVSDPDPDPDPGPDPDPDSDSDSDPDPDPDGDPDPGADDGGMSSDGGCAMAAGEGSGQPVGALLLFVALIAGRGRRARRVGPARPR